MLHSGRAAIGFLLVVGGLGSLTLGCGGSADVVASETGEAVAAVATPAPSLPPAGPTEEPTAVPEPTPIPEPTPEPTATAAPEPSPTPEPTPTPTSATFQESLERIRGLAGLTPKGLDYDDFVELTDESGQVSVTVPASWTDIERTPWDLDGELVGAALSASPNIDAFLTEWGTPGVFIAASDQLPFSSAEEMLEEFWFGDSCTFVGTEDYDDGAYVGLVDIYTECGDENAVFLQIIAGPPDGSYLIQAQMLAPTDQDLDAVFTAIDSFNASPP